MDSCQEITILKQTKQVRFLGYLWGLVRISRIRSCGLGSLKLLGLLTNRGPGALTPVGFMDFKLLNLTPPRGFRVCVQGAHTGGFQQGRRTEISRARRVRVQGL